MAKQAKKQQKMKSNKKVAKKKVPREGATTREEQRKRMDASKKRQNKRKKQKQIQVKEMKFRPGTEEGDYQVKLRNLKRFLEEGDKAKVSLRFRGREVVHPEIGMNLMKRIAEDLDELGSVESEPKFEGRQVIMVLAPRKNRKAQAPKEAS